MSVTAGSGVRASDGDTLDGTNWLLRRLPPEESARLHPHLKRVELETLKVLAKAGDDLQHAWFPENAIISVVREIDRMVVEAGTIGREGMAGLPALLGVTWTESTLLSEVPGSCLRMPFATLAEMLPSLPELRRRMGRFALSFIDQVGQTAACNARHSVDQRCARWLLLTRDRVDTDTIRLTHEVLAQMLGVRRASVTEVALALQKDGLIRYTRGRITIVDRQGLERLACDCYRTTRTRLEKLVEKNAGSHS